MPPATSRLRAAALAELSGPITPTRGLAARRLSFVSDPVALPYLTEAIELDLGYASLWDGFGRIGTEEAVAALVALTGSTNAGIANVARNVLARLRTR